jgi:hypothetical protein
MQLSLNSSSRIGGERYREYIITDNIDIRALEVRQGASRERDRLVLVLVKLPDRWLKRTGRPKIGVELASTHLEGLMQSRLPIILKYNEPWVGNPCDHIVRRCVFQEREEQLIPKVVASDEI